MATSIRHSRLALDRIIAGLLLGLAFLVMASVFVPGSIHADIDLPGAVSPPAVERVAPAPSMAEQADDVALGSIESTRYTAHLIGAADGTRFTIVEKATGTVLGERLTADLVKQLFPELSIDEMVTDPTAVLMTAERLD